MAYELPPTFALGPSRSYAYRPVTQPADWQYLLAHLNEEGLWRAAMKLGAAPSPQQLSQAILTDRTIALWNMEPKQGGARVATCVVSTVAQDWHVAAWHPGSLSQVRHLEAIEALSSAVMRADPAAEEVWTALPLPEPQGAEEALLALNFTEVPSDLDGGRIRTYGLFRYIWSSYHP